VAKKSRTPAPPKRVQAPQRRVESKRPRSAEDRRTLYMTIAFAASGVALVAVVVALIAVLGNKGGGGSGATKKIDESQLVGLQTGPAPWNAGLDHLPDRWKPLGLSPLPQEALHQHIHQHLDIFVNGKPVTIPVGIGIFGNEFTELHTHSAAPEGLPGPPGRPTGVIHVESPTDDTYSLGQFMGVWGVRFTPDCIGGYCKELTPWRVYVNGKLYTGDPTRIALKEHEEIAIVIGTPPKKIPSTFGWGTGL
jgi:hypothetical protein